MKNAVVGALVGMLFLTVVNISMFAYNYGRLAQAVDDLCRRVARVEVILDNLDGGS